MKVMDIHTHRPAPQPEGVISVNIGERELLERGFADGQLYSVGLHPWEQPGVYDDGLHARLRELAGQPEVVAIGECGIDLTPKGGPMYIQLQAFRRHIEISEEVGKPIVIHDVKADDIISGLRRDMKPTQPWAIHGYRKKPEAARMLLRTGCYLSFGELFNPGTLRSTPEERILAETDESQLSIEEIIDRLSFAYGKDLTEIIARNSAEFLHISKCDK